MRRPPYVRPVDLVTETRFRIPPYIGIERQRTVIIGHGKSAEGRSWGAAIDACDTVIRCWDCQWQNPADYGTGYDIGLYEAHPMLMPPLHTHCKRQPHIGWIASLLAPTSLSTLMPVTEMVDQAEWCQEAMALGGLGASGRLQFQRGTVAALWAIHRARPGDEVVLVGFDNTLAGRALKIEDGYSKVYRAAPSSYTFAGYIEGAQRYGNHDFGIERPYLDLCAKRRGVTLTFAQEKWGLLKALVLGDAKCVHEDARRALELFEPDAICATNNIGRDWEGRLDYWCTLHPERCPNWDGMAAELKKRLATGRNRPQTWAHKKANGIDRTTTDWQGSTGLLCVKMLREEGFGRIVLAGAPMSKDGGHYYDGKDWLQFNHYIGGWQKRREEIAPYVRSMSGFTRELLGEPTKEWIAT